MENSVKYLTYERYIELGGSLDLMSFNLLEYQSRKQIDYYTHNRLIQGVPEDIEKDIEMVMMALINENNAVSSTSNKKSETIDGYSVSYGDNTENSAKVKNTIISLLSGLSVDGVPLTYAGGLNDNKQFYYPIS